MRPLVFAHLADAHVGAWARNPALRERLRASVLRAIEVASDRGAEFLLMSGDLFHTPSPEPSEAAPVTAALRRFVEAGRRIYVIYGSHDYVAHRTSWLDVLAEAGVFVRVAPEAVRADGSRWVPALDRRLADGSPRRRHLRPLARARPGVLSLHGLLGVLCRARVQGFPVPRRRGGVPPSAPEGQDPRDSHRRPPARM